MVPVHVTDVTIIKEQAAAIIIMLRLLQYLDVNIQYVQQVTVIAADLNAKDVLDVLVMSTGLI
jgi:hypothetical protein